MTIRIAIQTLTRIVGWSVLGALLLTVGCASKAKTVAGPKVPPAEVAVYESTELLHSQYTLVQHLYSRGWINQFMGQASAVGVFLFVLTLVATLVQLRYFRAV